VADLAREFGVMQTLGAAPARIARVAVFEGLFVGLRSLLGARVFATPLSHLLGLVIGVFLFDAGLPLTFSPLALGAWFAVALLGCAVAGASPASMAARMTIRETLA
jgi:ABC-type lipoprotein release transport system permease subunit